MYTSIINSRKSLYSTALEGGFYHNSKRVTTHQYPPVYMWCPHHSNDRMFRQQKLLAAIGVEIWNAVMQVLHAAVLFCCSEIIINPALAS